MKKRIYLFSTFLILLNNCFGQASISNQSVVEHRVRVLYIINFSDRPAISTKNYIVDTKQELSAGVLPDSLCGNIRNLLNVDIIEVVNLKPKTKILTFGDAMNLYNISTRNRSLPVKIDDDVIDYPETLIISQNQIESIKIRKTTKGRYISIILKGYYELEKQLKQDKKNGVIYVQ